MPTRSASRQASAPDPQGLPYQQQTLIKTGSLPLTYRSRCVPNVSQRAAKDGGIGSQSRRRDEENALSRAKFAALAPQVDPMVDSTDRLKVALYP